MLEVGLDNPSQRLHVPPSGMRCDDFGIVVARNDSEGPILMRDGFVPVPCAAGMPGASAAAWRCWIFGMADHQHIRMHQLDKPVADGRPLSPIGASPPTRRHQQGRVRFAGLAPQVRVTLAHAPSKRISGGADTVSDAARRLDEPAVRGPLGVGGIEPLTPASQKSS